MTFLFNQIVYKTMINDLQLGRVWPVTNWAVEQSMYIVTRCSGGGDQNDIELAVVPTSADKVTSPFDWHM